MCLKIWCDRESWKILGTKHGSTSKEQGDKKPDRGYMAYLYSGVQILIGLCKLQQVRAFKLKYFSSHSEKWKQMRWIMSPLTTNNEGGANMKYHLIWLWCGLMLLYLLLWDAISSPACSANVLNNATFGHINIHMFSCIIRKYFFFRKIWIIRK